MQTIINAQIYNATTELTTPKARPTNETKAEIEP